MRVVWSKLVGLVALVIILAVAFSALSAWVILQAWNYVAVATFGAPVLNFNQVWIAFIALGFLGNCVRSFSSSNK